MIIGKSPWNERGRRENFLNVHLNFPIFPKLEFLHISYGSLHSQILPNVKFIFPNGKSFVNYETDFPSLKSLTVWPRRFGVYPGPEVGDLFYCREASHMWVMCGSFYGMFFPAIVHRARMEICNTLQRLDVPYQVRSDRLGKVPLLPKSAETAIAKMFPNVRNKWIDSIRERARNVVKSATSRNKREVKKKAKKKTPVPSLFHDFCFPWTKHLKCDKLNYSI